MLRLSNPLYGRRAEPIVCKNARSRPPKCMTVFPARLGCKNREFLKIRCSLVFSNQTCQAHIAGLVIWSVDTATNPSALDLKQRLGIHVFFVLACFIEGECRRPDPCTCDCRSQRTEETCMLQCKRGEDEQTAGLRCFGCSGRSQTRFAVRDVAALPTVATDVLTGFAEGLSVE
eukprot:933658-Pleurochrysis_carterae.AAC.2